MIVRIKNRKCSVRNQLEKLQGNFKQLGVAGSVVQTVFLLLWHSLLFSRWYCVCTGCEDHYVNSDLKNVVCSTEYVGLKQLDCWKMCGSTPQSHVCFVLLCRNILSQLVNLLLFNELKVFFVVFHSRFFQTSLFKMRFVHQQFTFVLHSLWKHCWHHFHYVLCL